MDREYCWLNEIHSFVDEINIFCIWFDVGKVVGRQHSQLLVENIFSETFETTTTSAQNYCSLSKQESRICTIYNCQRGPTVFISQVLLFLIF